MKIEIKNKLQELLLENPTKNSIGRAKGFIERDLPKMLVTIEKKLKLLQFGAYR